MKMNEYNSKVSSDVLAAISGLEIGSRSIGDVQAVLQSAIPQFENDGSEVADAVRLAEADIEEIQFTTLRDEQLGAVIFRLRDLRDILDEASDI
ncbi:hypothetical protein [Luteimicrobium subarcticum]|uniref:hypothetical protein n=1 Tax=Luteimicrobium subarcticum TaxID=620910 RepID=UPI000C24A5DA|nr:hypothetical protein [Luteimicrobium subarcticum]